MKSNFHFLAALGLMLVSACAAYTENGMFGGYREVPLAADTYRISSDGNNLTTRARANAIAFVRAAELAISNGYSRLEVLDYNEWEKTRTVELPGKSKTEFEYDRRRGRGSATTEHAPAPTIVEEHPRTDIVVRFPSPGSADYASALNVRQLLSKYGATAGLSQARLNELMDRATANEAWRGG